MKTLVLIVHAAGPDTVEVALAEGAPRAVVAAAAGAVLIAAMRHGVSIGEVMEAAESSNVRACCTVPTPVVLQGNGE